jgi:filamentous hemagglutinin
MGKLTQNGNRAVKEALEKQIALKAETEAIRKTRIENNVYSESSLADPAKPVFSATGPWIPASQLSPAQATKMARDAIPEGAVIENTINADILNKKAVGDDPKFKPPYISGATVYEFSINKSSKFVRVYAINEKGEGQVKNWVMLENDIRGLSPEQIASKYSLPQVPTHITDVFIPKNKIIRVSVASDINIFYEKSIGGNGGGGGLQFEILDGVKSTWFSNQRRLK